jgi:DNA adenine methylase
MKPFLKWVGGKTQIIHDVMELFPKKMHNYHEPFLGGGSVLLALLSSEIRVSGTIYASDLNLNLIGLYQNIQSNPEEFIREIKKIIAEYEQCSGSEVNRKPANREEATSQESYYYWIRTQFNAFSIEERTSVIASAMLLFMNKTCFRGIYREGPNGFNVPFGNYKNPSILDEAHIRQVSTLIRNVVFIHCSYVDALSRLTRNDFVYLDPPYAPENETSFVSYTSHGFGLDDHTRLFKECREMKEKKVKMLMSNADVQLVKDAFPSFRTRTISCRRAIHSKKPETRTNEVLITNY